MSLGVWRSRDGQYVILQGSSDSASYIRVLDVTTIAGALAAAPSACGRPATWARVALTPSARCVCSSAQQHVELCCPQTLWSYAVDTGGNFLALLLLCMRHCSALACYDSK